MLPAISHRNLCFLFGHKYEGEIAKTNWRYGIFERWVNSLTFFSSKFNLLHFVHFFLVFFLFSKSVLLPVWNPPHTFSIHLFFPSVLYTFPIDQSVLVGSQTSNKEARLSNSGTDLGNAKFDKNATHIRVVPLGSISTHHTALPPSCPIQRLWLSKAIYLFVCGFMTRKSAMIMEL